MSFGTGQDVSANAVWRLRNIICFINRVNVNLVVVSYVVPILCRGYGVANEQSGPRQASSSAGPQGNDWPAEFASPGKLCPTYLSSLILLIHSLSSTVHFCFGHIIRIALRCFASLFPLYSLSLCYFALVEIRCQPTYPQTPTSNIQICLRRDALVQGYEEFLDSAKPRNSSYGR